MSRRTPPPDRPRGKKISSLKFLGRYLKPYRGEVGIAILALFITASSVLTMGHGLRYLVDEGLSKGNPHLLNNSLFVLVGVIMALAAASYARSYFISRVGEKVVADIRRDAFAHVVMLSPGYFETTRTGEVLSRLTTDTTMLQNVVGSTITFAMRNFIMFIGGTVLLAITSLRLTSFVFLILPLAVIPIIVLGRKVRVLSRETQEKVADLSVHIEETISSVRVVQAFGMEKLRSAEFDDKVDISLAKATDRIAMRSALSSMAISLIFGSIGLVLWIGGHDVITGRITPGDLSAFVFYSVVVAASAGAITEIIGDLQRAAGAAERITDLMQTMSPISAPAEPVILKPPVKGNLKLDNVTFSYPTRLQHKALNNFSLDIESGKHIALVGPSGAGKTTIFQLLLRFYDPESGIVSLDGVAVNRLDPAALRTSFGLVPQDPVIFSTDVWDNIRCGRADASDDEVRAAAAAAAALEFIEKLPEGFNSFLGEKGVRLSGGQKQRIAIARAILRNPAVLLLDEATSSLDSENEKLVQQALERLMNGRTSLVIAHRLATVREADEIIVMDNGGIAERGTHHDLINKGGLYSRLANLQFQ